MIETQDDFGNARIKKELYSDVKKAQNSKTRAFKVGRARRSSQQNLPDSPALSRDSNKANSVKNFKISSKSQLPASKKDISRLKSSQNKNRVSTDYDPEMRESLYK